MISAERFLDTHGDYAAVRPQGDRVNVEAVEGVSDAEGHAFLSYTPEQAEALAEALLDAARVVRTTARG